LSFRRKPESSDLNDVQTIMASLVTLFLIFVFVANKFICTWCCQFGTLQGFIFSLNRDSKDRKGALKQFKPPFILSNTIGVVFLTAFTLFAFFWKVDFVEFIACSLLENLYRLLTVGRRHF
jgi:hypothetical protein